VSRMTTYPAWTPACAAVVTLVLWRGPRLVLRKALLMIVSIGSAQFVTCLLLPNLSAVARPLVAIAVGATATFLGCRRNLAAPHSAIAVAALITSVTVLILGPADDGSGRGVLAWLLVYLTAPAVLSALSSRDAR
jgi:hypothetical protein